MKFTIVALAPLFLAVSVAATPVTVNLEARACDFNGLVNCGVGIAQHIAPVVGACAAVAESALKLAATIASAGIPNPADALTLSSSIVGCAAAAVELGLSIPGECSCLVI